MKIIAIELEPTPYKYDLWNAVNEIYGEKLTVIFTIEKDWSKDNGHKYKILPKSKFNFKKFKGGGLKNSIINSIIIIKNYLNQNDAFYIVSGYSSFETIIIIFWLILTNKKFSLISDKFKNDKPKKILLYFKYFLRNFIRNIIFKHSKAVLVCGKLGINSAIQSNCNINKIYDFPYTVDLNRIKCDIPKYIPDGCLDGISKNKIIIYFSGRMIDRKGLKSLLIAVSSLDRNENWVLWIEGDGPKLDYFKALSFNLGISDHCIFLGFCQYDLHSWLLKNSTIVVVPSFQDNWGIVVDEALQLGKPVISSYTTGSAIDRIENNINGFLVNSKDPEELRQKIYLLINDAEARKIIEVNARLSKKIITPADNAKLLQKLINELQH